MIAWKSVKHLKTSSILTGILTILLTWTTVGCRLGNKVETPPKPERDPYIGYFQTEAASLTFCSNVGGGCINVAAANVKTLMPTYVKTVMNNPLEFNRTSESDTLFFLLNPENHGYYLPVELNRSSGSFNGPSGASGQLWLYPECSNDLSIEVMGLAEPGREEGFDGYVTIGRISANISWSYNFTGNCAQSLQEMKACYLDHDDCLSSDPNQNVSRQLFVSELFGPWINSGQMTVNDITSVSTLTFDASYD